jgi:type IV fimbrial biogenesis protein FimT
MLRRKVEYQMGLTLIELLFAMAMVAIALVLATSALSATAHAARTSSGTASLYTTFLRARTAAISSNADIILCPSVDGTRCSVGDHWESGWIGFVASDGSTERMADAPIVLRQEALPKGVHVVTTSGRTRLRFQGLGGGNAGSNATFTFCDGRGPRKSTAYALSNNGNLHPTATEPANVTAACAGL